MANELQFINLYRHCILGQGDNTVLLQQVAAALLKEVRQKGVAGYIQILIPKFDPNPLSNVSHHLKHGNNHLHPSPSYSLLLQANLRDTDFFNHAMSFREARILRALVNKIQRFSHLSSFEAWNKCLDVAIELAKAYIDRKVVALFSAAIETADPNIRPMLHALCSLHALWTIQGAFYRPHTPNVHIKRCTHDTSLFQRIWASL